LSLFLHGTGHETHRGQEESPNLKNGAEEEGKTEKKGGRILHANKAVPHRGGGRKKGLKPMKKRIKEKGKGLQIGFTT